MLDVVNVKVILTRGARLLAIAKPGDAAADLAAHTRYDVKKNQHRLLSARGVILWPKTRRMFGTGVQMDLPEGFRARVCSRSGLSGRDGIEVGAGLIDNGYHGEFCVVLHNHGWWPKRIKFGDRIAQVCVERYTKPNFIETKQFDRVTERATTGYGSTGV